MIQEAKPILLLRVNKDAVKYNSGGLDGLEHISKMMQFKFTDYHVLVLPSNQIKEVAELEVFSAKDITESSRDELQALIIKEIKDMKDGTI